MDKFKKRRFFWIPVFTGWIISAFTLIYVTIVQKENNEFYQTITNKKLETIREIFSSTLDNRIDSMNLIFDRWEEEVSINNWSKVLYHYLRESEGLLKVTWVRNKENVQWVISKETGTSIEPVSNSENILDTQITVEEYQPNLTTIVVSIPTYNDTEINGYLKAVIDFNELVDSSISRYLENDYRFMIFNNGQQIYSHGNTAIQYPFKSVEKLHNHGLDLDIRLLFNSEIFNVSMLKNTFFLLTIGSILSLMIPSLLFFFYHEYARNQVLQRLLNVKDEFLSNISHELRTPLHGVISNISMLSPSGVDQRDEKCLKRIKTSSKVLEEIINNILDYLKMDSGRLELELKSNDIRALINEIYDVTVQTAEEKNVKLSIFCHPSIPNGVFCDALRVKQILMNLVNNAIKFTHQGEVSIHVHPVNQKMLKFEVKDTGIGISKDKQKVIFEKFSQEDNTTTRKYGGTGLGLAICQQLVKAMRGNIGCISEKNRGSTFWFEIPLKAPAAKLQHFKNHFLRPFLVKH